MTGFTLHDQNSAPDAARPLLDDSRKSFGMIPGLHAVMAEAPGVLEGYKTLHRLVLESSFDNDEKTVVWQTVNVEHGCHYCVPAHTGIARMMNVSDDITNALRDEAPLADARLEALRSFTLAVVRKRGEVSREDLQAFHNAGFTKRQVLEVILIVSQKVMSNYINHIAETPVDEPFRKFAWQKNR
ncbi:MULTISPECIES: carboxymuconolactone decarboxylase family protein [Marinobacter]|uniref:Carboxymuconolactone decarboxylase n=1 Tax=Marinobacter profundi TaxID=2666256 RepID=A0A2G1UL87_9GAMM|nr:MULTISPECIES: carboxymuconolactone decarboxylase family protein [Marinobacter]MBD3658455.1 carboxymuconolactone decarboxylase family protein [Marinobacter sp.]PHQ15266.1 carboxymuconolactone decarboxylase [Marinobacter profundi]